MKTFVISAGLLLALALPAQAAMLPSTAAAAGDSTSLLVVYGEARWPGGVWAMPDGTEIRVRNNRTGQIITARVGATSAGAYEAVFFDVDDCVAVSGDTVSFGVDGAVCSLANGTCVLNRNDILAGMARHDVIPDYLSDAPLPRQEPPLISAYPNPFNPHVTISVELQAAAQLSLTIFDVRGRLVSVLAERELDAGAHRFQWNGTNQAGSAMPTGAYLVRVTTPTSSTDRKIALLR